VQKGVGRLCIQGENPTTSFRNAVPSGNQDPSDHVSPSLVISRICTCLTRGTWKYLEELKHDGFDEGRERREMVTRLLGIKSCDFASPVRWGQEEIEVESPFEVMLFAEEVEVAFACEEIEYSRLDF
jgi:hypothetical protein